MKIGMVGLGRMGANMVPRLLRAGHECQVYDVSEQAVQGSRCPAFRTRGRRAGGGETGRRRAAGGGRRRPPGRG